LHLVTDRPGAGHERPDAALGDGRFHEHGGDLALDQQVHQFLYALQARFRFGAEALNALDLEAVATAEIVEGVMGGHQDAALRRHAGQDLLCVLVEPRQLLEIGGGVRPVGVGAGGVELGELAAHRLHRLAPGQRVHPDMRVVMPGEGCRLEQELLVDQLGDGVHRLAAGGHPDQRVGHLPLEQKTVVEHDVGAQHPGDVRARRRVEVRIDARAHQLGDLGALPGDVAHDIADHAGGRDDLQRRLRRA
jgi:hypothetical protein